MVVELEDAEDVMEDADDEDRLMGWRLVTRVCRQSWGSSPTLSPASRQRRLRSLPSPALTLLTHAAILLCCLLCYCVSAVCLLCVCVSVLLCVSVAVLPCVPGCAVTRTDRW